ncbi:putative plasma membrane calcium-transporting atpase 4 protein [Zalerion maritima]|uniref:Calcium-transporting ATPase n=1 Tax=Zalerion maritima TaxID=339359 RepID=A0AAD5RGD1_9PEZI|nr:putative plasma membrane calcium-transporting atpase 4 protein [Zalerion maritima]
MTTSTENAPPPVSSRSTKDIKEDEFYLDAVGALAPDPGREDSYRVDNNVFAFSPGQLGKLFNPKSHNALYAMGGIDGIERGLQTDRHSGLSADETTIKEPISFDKVAHPDAANDWSSSAAAQPPSSAGSGSPNDSGGGGSAQDLAKQHKVQPRDGHFEDRLRVFSDNRLPSKPPKTIFQLLWANYNDKVLILLTAAAVVSLALGLYQTFGVEHEPGEPKVEWVEGVAIVVAIVIVVLVGTINDFKMERQFRKLNQKNDERNIKVNRNGKTQEISIYDIVVGDVVHMSPGDMIPVDGIFIEGHGVKCDESSATGESDLLKKMPAEQVYKALVEGNKDVHKLDCFVLSGSKVSEGTGTFLTTATGIYSCFGRISLGVRKEQGPTPLQVKLNGLADSIAKYGGGAALLLFIVLFIKFLVGLPNNNNNAADKGQEFLQLFITAVTVVVVAVPEGLPLAVTLALSFATKRMLKDNNLVRVLRAVETGGNATTICSDKTGTLTTNQMTVTAATIGKKTSFNATPALGSNGATENGEKTMSGDSSESADMSPRDFVATLGDGIKKLMIESNAINSTAFEAEEEGKKVFVGSKTETALLSFCQDELQAGPVHESRGNANIIQVVPFDSAAKYMATVVKLGNGKFRAYVKGASEIILSKCGKVIADPTASEITEENMEERDRESMSQAIANYASHSLRVIGASYRDFESWPPAGHADPEYPDQAVFSDVHENMTLLGLFGIKDPLRPGVANAIERCNGAGIVVRMVTGDNILTASAIARECGILRDDDEGIPIEGPKFRKLQGDELRETCRKLRVMARSSPDDKLLLVETLKSMGETVTVTGDGTNDGPALKGADVGFSMGIAGTEVAKEASAIVLLDDNFVSVVRAVEWGRTVNDAVKKFLQFQLTVNITAVALTFISAVSSSDNESVLNAVQLLWVNLIMDTLAALALATDPPSPHVLERPPQRKSAPLITLTMGKMIIGQAIFQLVITLVLNFAGPSMTKILATTADTADAEQEKLNSLIFNTFVWMQIFNEFNNRRLDNKLNIFEGMLQNYFFIGINVIMIGGQILIIFVGGEAFKITPLNGQQWGISVILGLLSIPIGVLIRVMPDSVFRALIPWPVVNLFRKLSPAALFRRLFKKQPKKLDGDEEAAAAKAETDESSVSSEEDHDLRVTRFVRGGRVSTFSEQVYLPRHKRLQNKLKSAGHRTREKLVG